MGHHGFLCSFGLSIFLLRGSSSSPSLTELTLIDRYRSMS